MTDLPVSVLDLAPVPTGSSPGDALRATIELARHVERLGFRRFWVAEHHNMPGIASSAPLDRPYAMVAAGVICAETDERARWLAGPSALSFLRLRSGRPGTMPAPEEAEAYSYSDLDRAMIADRRGSQLIGSPDTVREGMAELVKHTRADELMITTMVFDPADRLRSFELLAEKVLPVIWPG